MIKQIKQQQQQKQCKHNNYLISVYYIHLNFKAMDYYWSLFQTLYFVRHVRKAKRMWNSMQRHIQ